MRTKKVQCMILVGLMLNLFFFQTLVTAETKEDRFASKVRVEVKRIGTGRESRVKVKLKDKTKISGYVNEITEASFTVIHEKNNTAHKVYYAQVGQIRGRNNSTGIAIAAVVGLVVVLGIIIAVTRR